MPSFLAIFTIRFLSTLREGPRILTGALQAKLAPVIFEKIGGSFYGL